MPLYGEPGQRIGYEVTGTGLPLVLVHGFTASRASFLTNIPGLSRHFTVVNTELLGHGDSDAPEGPDGYGPGPAVQRLAGLWRDLGHDRVLLCGHSLGGALGLRLALDEPDSLAGLIVINSNSAFGGPGWRETVRPGLLQMAARVRTRGLESLRGSWLYPGRSKRLPVEAREQLVRDFDRLSPAGVAGTAEALTADVNAVERLGELRVPTLVVFGDRDETVGKSLPAFMERLPDGMARLAVLPGAGHAANLEDAPGFEAALLSFAREIGWLHEPRYESESPSVSEWS